MKAILTLAALGLAAGSAVAAPKDKNAETVIPFVSSLGSIEWKKAADDAVYIRGGNGQWYMVRTTNRCTRLRTALGIGFQTGSGGQLDRHGALLVEGTRCPVASVTLSEAPPKKPRRKAG